jgi:hypothetical protein
MLLSTPSLRRNSHAKYHPGRSVAALVLILLVPHLALAVPSFASQTGKPCSQCHTLSFGPALTAYGRQFKLNGYTFDGVDLFVPLALFVQGGYSHTETAPPAPLAPHFSANDNFSVDQVSLFIATRITDHLGVFMQSTYSGEKRHYNWDNTDIRYARPVTLFGTDAIVGISLNNNPTVQDLWTSTPAWSYPYITSPLVPSPGSNPLIFGSLAQVVAGATAYTMIHDSVYLEAGAYWGLSDHWLDNVGLYPSNNLHINGASPYWRAVYQVQKDPHYLSFGTFGIDVKMQPDPTVPNTNRFTDVGVDATYQYTPPDAPGAVLATASFIHEKQDLAATFNAGGADDPKGHLDAFRMDASYAYNQTYSAGFGLFNITSSTDFTYYGNLTGSIYGKADTRGYIVQLEYVPFGKAQSLGHPWINVRLGLQYTGYLDFNGGRNNYDGTGRSASQNNSLFLFYWLIF